MPDAANSLTQPQPQPLGLPPLPLMQPGREPVVTNWASDVQVQELRHMLPGGNVQTLFALEVRGYPEGEAHQYPLPVRLERVAIADDPTTLELLGAVAAADGKLIRPQGTKIVPGTSVVTPIETERLAEFNKTTGELDIPRVTLAEVQAYAAVVAAKPGRAPEQLAQLAALKPALEAADHWDAALHLRNVAAPSVARPKTQAVQVVDVSDNRFAQMNGLFLVTTGSTGGSLEGLVVGGGLKDYAAGGTKLSNPVNRGELGRALSDEEVLRTPRALELLDKVTYGRLEHRTELENNALLRGLAEGTPLVALVLDRVERTDYDSPHRVQWVSGEQAAIYDGTKQQYVPRMATNVERDRDSGRATGYGFYPDAGRILVMPPADADQLKARCEVAASGLGLSFDEYAGGPQGRVLLGLGRVATATGLTVVPPSIEAPFGGLTGKGGVSVEIARNNAGAFDVRYTKDGQLLAGRSNVVYDGTPGTDGTAAEPERFIAAVLHVADRGKDVEREYKGRLHAAPAPYMPEAKAVPGLVVGGFQVFAVEFPPSGVHPMGGALYLRGGRETHVVAFADEKLPAQFSGRVHGGSGTHYFEHGQPLATVAAGGLPLAPHRSWSRVEIPRPKPGAAAGLSVKDSFSPSQRPVFDFASGRLGTLDGPAGLDKDGRAVYAVDSKFGTLEGLNAYRREVLRVPELPAQPPGKEIGFEKTATGAVQRFDSGYELRTEPAPNGGRIETCMLDGKPHDAPGRPAVVQVEHDAEGRLAAVTHKHYEHGVQTATANGPGMRMFQLSDAGHIGAEFSRHYRDGVEAADAEGWSRRAVAFDAGGFVAMEGFKACPGGRPHRENGPAVEVRKYDAAGALESEERQFWHSGKQVTEAEHQAGVRAAKPRTGRDAGMGMS